MTTGAALTTRIVTGAERPDLLGGVPDLLAARWPVFMLAGHPGHDVDLTRLAADAPANQVLLVDDADRVLGAGLSVPASWDGTVAGLPDGWDGAVAAGGALLDRDGTPNAYVALSITLDPAVSGQDRTPAMLGALKAAAARAGADTLLVPVRPVHKTRYPDTPMAEYLTWRTDAGEVFDPWLRDHLRLGGTQLGIADPSMTITGTVAEWRGWTGLDLPASGAYRLPGGLAPLVVDLVADTGTYREPNVWVAHRLAG